MCVSGFSILGGGGGSGGNALTCNPILLIVPKHNGLPPTLGTPYILKYAPHSI